MEKVFVMGLILSHCCSRKHIWMVQFSQDYPASGASCLDANCLRKKEMNSWTNSMYETICVCVYARVVGLLSRSLLTHHEDQEEYLRLCSPGRTHVVRIETFHTFPSRMTGTYQLEWRNPCVFHDMWKLRNGFSNFKPRVIYRLILKSIIPLFVSNLLIACQFHVFWKKKNFWILFFGPFGSLFSENSSKW